MACSNLIEAAVKKGDISTSLFKKSQDKEMVIDLQRVLFELGFRKELKWDSYQADGDYGNATVATVAAFAKKNNHQSNGSKVTKTLAKLLLQRHDFLPEMYVLWSIHRSDLRTRKYISKGTRLSITAIQVLLNELGYGNILNFPKYGADGIYGNSTRNAVVAYAKDHGIDSDGDWLTRPLINAMLEDINAFYGKHWSDLAENHLPGQKSPLALYQASRFQGKPCRVDFQFIPTLEKINAYAKEARVFIHITSSFRTTTNVKGAIVEPVKNSNHLAGHAIDMNIIYGDNLWANSSLLIKYPAVPAPVKHFLQLVIEDPKLRWGGQFNVKDVVHIDDHLNKNGNKWTERYLAMQQAVQLGI